MQVDPIHDVGLENLLAISLILRVLLDNHAYA